MIKLCSKAQMPHVGSLITSLLFFAYAWSTTISLLLNIEEWNNSESCHRALMVDLVVAGISQFILFLVFLRCSVQNTWNGYLTFSIILSSVAFISSASVGAYMIGHGRDQTAKTCDVNQFMFVMVTINAGVLYTLVGIVCLILVVMCCNGCCDRLEGKESGVCMDE